MLGVFGFTQLRAWSRISVVIAFCAFVAVGLAFDRLRVPSECIGISQSCVAAVIVVVGLFDMTPAHVLPSYDENRGAVGCGRVSSCTDVEGTLGRESRRVPAAGDPVSRVPAGRSG